MFYKIYQNSMGQFTTWGIHVSKFPPTFRLCERLVPWHSTSAQSLTPAGGPKPKCHGFQGESEPQTTRRGEHCPMVCTVFVMVINGH